MQQNTTYGRGAKATPLRERGADSDDSPTGRARLRVLVVDDEPLIGTTLRILLDEHDVIVVTAGRAARALLERGDDFDAILCDLMLEDVSGMDLAQWLQAERPDLASRVVFMTGGAFTEEARSFLRSVPIDRQLEKPFSSEEIYRVLASL